MHREFSFYSPGLFRVGTAKLEMGENYREEQPLARFQTISEGCAPTFAGVQPIWCVRQRPNASHLA
jgi:hypothetical protein